MKLLASILLVMFISLSLTSCGDSDSSYSFDVRSCNGDLFSEIVSEDANKEEREELMRVWLTEQEIQVVDLDLKLDFLQAVCEACVICPTGDRYFITTNTKVTEDQITALNFLNWEEM